MAALSVSGLLRLAEVFASQGSGTTQYWSAILSLANWVGNVILPVYGGIEIAGRCSELAEFFERLNIGDDWIRHFIAGGACLCVSGLMRLMEHFIASRHKRGGVMALKMSPVSRNLHAKVTMLGLGTRRHAVSGDGLRDRDVGRPIPLL